MAVALLPMGELAVVVAPPVGWPVGVAVPEAVEDGVPDPLHVFPASTASKLAQVMRVLLPKWNTILRFPKKAPMPSLREANSSV